VIVLGLGLDEEYKRRFLYVLDLNLFELVSKTIERLRD